MSTDDLDRIAAEAAAQARRMGRVPLDDAEQAYRAGRTPAPSPNGQREAEAEHAFRLLAELLEDPSILRPPEAVLPRLVWRGRTTLLAGPDKSGKSTLAAHGVAALSRGAPWLGERIAPPGSAVVAAPDEAVADTVRRLNELGTDPTRVRVLILRPPDLLAALTRELEAHAPDLAVIDSLAEWARLTCGSAPEDGDASAWGAVVRPLVHLAHAHDCGLLLLHHPRRSDGQYRGSGEIAAAVDALVEMTLPQTGEDPTLRRFRGRARWPVEDWSLRLGEDGRPTLGGGGPVSLDARILADLAEHPGTSRSALRERLGARKPTLTSALERLVAAGALVDRGHDRGSRLYLPHDVTEDLLP